MLALRFCLLPATSADIFALELALELLIFLDPAALLLLAPTLAPLLLYNFHFLKSFCLKNKTVNTLTALTL